MLTKIGVAALLGTIGTAVVGGGSAKADEPCRNEVAPVTVAAPVVAPVAYGYGYGNGYGYGYGYAAQPGVYYRHDRREELERMRREQREAAFRHGAWLHEHGGWGRGDRR
ncbi:MAG TPA: hypothetical protein VHB97_06455 [Polyangia bacterium]|nr:hypothetical protein [Polyangia bacterium]